MKIVERSSVEEQWVDGILERLRSEATPERAAKEQAYLKMEMAFLGATVPATRKAVVALHREQPDLSHPQVIGLVEALWGREIFELRMAAVDVLDLDIDRLTPDDAPLLERLIRGSGTWALVDGLAASVTGALVDRFPDGMDATLTRWAGDPDFWLRRAALLGHLYGLRRGRGDFEGFAALADPMLGEREFFIRKAIGWVLRETGKKRPELVVAWLEPRVVRAAGLTVREAVKYLPESDRDRLLAARRKG